MNYKDKDKIFEREIKLFEKLIQKLTENPSQQAIDIPIFKSWGGQSENKEGGNMELKDRKIMVKPLLLT